MPAPVQICLGGAGASVVASPSALQLIGAAHARLGMPASHSWSVGEAHGGARRAGLG